MTVAIKDLNACREIDDVEVVVFVYGGRAGLNEVTRLNAMMTPNNFWLAGRTAASCQQQTKMNQPAHLGPYHSDKHTIQTIGTTDFVESANGIATGFPFFTFTHPPDEKRTRM
jgi:hypothetical protein